jgi:hypothetical protein
MVRLSKAIWSPPGMAAGGDRDDRIGQVTREGQTTRGRDLAPVDRAGQNWAMVISCSPMWGRCRASTTLGVGDALAEDGP